MRRDVFRAIADPTRREIIHLVAEQPLNMEAIAGNFKKSRSAIYKHIKILTECGLLVIRTKGRERYCEVKLEKLGDLVVWVEPYRHSWQSRLISLERLITQSKAAYLPESGAP
ncbi:ArsR/SmtB family transcription factor [Adhaeribacter pallidiroseus]|uniref:HTH arsR-type domain-containing protein n=1 Tax=Adhaeribacter pallidiroseus TaxID=2072847 RepID=A0A369QFV9_9BACT|nr:metalloregulator ArsR/SmtB family transcription factor [Adhaeribacter pallidiroseus]RDC63803.1 hypothetical protein AHMF7616_02412 [Adhaeribacter pallidiroseus]